MNSQIEDVVYTCGTTCQQNRSCQQKEPLQNREVLDSPCCDIATYLFECHGDTYLVVVYAYSEYIEIKKINTTTSMAVIRVLSEMFASHGVCNTLFSDNGPQFSSEEFKSFSTEWKFKHVTSPPTYPQCNGLLNALCKQLNNLSRNVGKINPMST